MIIQSEAAQRATGGGAVYGERPAPAAPGSRRYRAAAAAAAAAAMMVVAAAAAAAMVVVAAAAAVAKGEEEEWETFGQALRSCVFVLRSRVGLSGGRPVHLSI